MRIAAVTSTELFGGTAARPLQIIRVGLSNDGPGLISDPAAVVAVRIEGAGARTPEPASLAGWAPGEERIAEVGVEVAVPAVPGGTRQVVVIAEVDAGAGRSSGGIRTAGGGRSPDGIRTAARTTARAEITLAEPGWTMWMVSHFHYDPVWWATQGQFTQTRLFLPDEDGSLPDARTAFELVRLHLDAARRDGDYKFVLAEIDYLKPHFDACPEDREDLLGFIRQGRIEIVGGAYNEPNTNLTCAESTIRNAIFGLSYQRAVLGADPSVAWMLDAFGHDPSYPSLMAAAGLTESAWARGPFHQWGPNRTVGDNARMQFAAEFEWLSPDGHGLLTGYMPNHYGAGWVTHSAATLDAAEEAAYEQFRQLAPVAATRNVLLPVGADHVIPSRWATGIHRDWNSRYAWPRFVTALPSDFFAAVRKDAADQGIWITPQTRDMNPVYTGKDVSYIDTKQAQRAAEVAIGDGERLATLAWLAGAGYPAASLDRAWRLLAFGAHHDAITGTEGDQVYLDLLAGWREAYERGDAARRDGAGYLAGLAATATVATGTVATGTVATGTRAAGAGRAVVVFNTLPRDRSALATATLEFPAADRAGWAGLRDDSGTAVPFLVEDVRRHPASGSSPGGSLARLTLTFRAADVPALGYRTYLAVPVPRPPDGQQATWQPADGAAIGNEAFEVEADPASGGTLARILDKCLGTELLAGPGNELILQQEYDYHPRWGEGPWLLSPKGPGTGSAGQPAAVHAQRCPIGSRLITELAIGELRITQETLLWDGAERVEFRTHVDGSIGQDRLLRVRFPANVQGGMPVYQTAAAVIGRSPGTADIDVAEHDYTMDNPAHEWFAAGSTARVALTGGASPRTHAIGVAEVIPPGQAFRTGVSGTSIQNGFRGVTRDLMTALAGAGVTATCSRPDGPRYGSVDLDSNLPDVRIALGGAEQNPFTARVLAAASRDEAKQLADQLSAGEAARVWVPAAKSRPEAFAPGADLRGPLDLPVLIVAGDDLAAAVRALIADLADATIEVPARVRPATADPPNLAPHTVALLNRGTPGSLVTPAAEMYISLMRSCSAWPSGVWMDGDKRTAPDGSSFAWQHWSHTFEYALAAGPGDWRSAGFPLAGQDYNTDLLTCVTDLHDGPLPAAASLASVEPAGPALLALKPRGNPLDPAARQPRRADGVTVRLADCSGRAAADPARVRLFTGVAAASATGLLEDSGGAPLPVRDGAAELDLAGRATVTAILVPGPWPAADIAAQGGSAAPAIADAAPRPPASPRPSASPPPPGSLPPDSSAPVFARYWLHGTGPAPEGNMPVAVHLSPARIALPQRADRLRLTVACGPAPATGTVRLVLPAPLRAEPAGPFRYDLGPRGHAAWDVSVQAPPGAPPGRYFAAARITEPGGRPVEDVALVTIGEPAEPALDLPLDDLLPLLVADQDATAAELAIALAPARLELRPGQTGRLDVTVTSAASSQVRGDVQVVSPFSSWVERWWTAGLVAEPGETATLTFPVTAPAAARRGQHWWALARVMYFGRVRYSEAAEIIVTG